MLNGMHKPNGHKKMTKILSTIQLKGTSDECVGGPLGANISDNPRGVTDPGLKGLELVDNISGSCGGG